MVKNDHQLIGKEACLSITVYLHSAYAYPSAIRPDTLWSAWCLVAANDGAPGVDGVTIQQIKDDDPHAFVEQIQEELRTKTYRTRRGL